MTIIDEYEVFALYVGETINMYKLKGISKRTLGVGSYRDCEEFCICLNDVCGKEKDLINYSIIDEWILKGVIIEVYVYIKENLLIGGHILKYKVISNFTYRMDSTQKEIEIVSNLLKCMLKGE